MQIHIFINTIIEIESRQSIVLLTTTLNCTIQLMSLVKFDEPRVGIITNVNKFSSKFRKQVTNRQTILIDAKRSM